MKEERYFDLSVLVGNWESVNLHPTVIIYRNGNTYLLSLIHMNETSKQASPATYEIQEDENGYFISYNLKRLSIGYDVRLDMLKLSSLAIICVIKKKTDMEILDNKSNEIASFFTALDELLDTIGQSLKNRTPHLNGEKYLTNKDVCRMLHISTRTLLDWRDTGKIPFIRIKGKILYRESDLINILNAEYTHIYK